MTDFRHIRILVILALCILICGCAPSFVEKSLPEGGLILGEVKQVATRDWVAEESVKAKNEDENPINRLNKIGFTYEQIVNEQVVFVKTRLMWNKKQNREQGMVVLAIGDLDLESGNIVEIIVKSDPPHSINRVRAKNLKDGKCSYQDVQHNMIVDKTGVINLVGSSGYAYLYCEGIEDEGRITAWRLFPEEPLD